MSYYPIIKIDIATQTLHLLVQEDQITSFPISSAKNGTGQLEGSGCTPLGKHSISEKFGEGLPINSVFVARQFTGELYTPELANMCPNRDWILTRILWLTGHEDGFNQGQCGAGSCDTKSRYIYIHGTPDTEPMGIPLSHGCIRMRNHDILTLFENVPVGTLVFIA